MSTDFPVVNNISLYSLHYTQLSSVNLSIRYVIEAYVFVYCISGSGRSSSAVTDVGCCNPGRNLGFSEVLAVVRLYQTGIEAAVQVKFSCMASPIVLVNKSPPPTLTTTTTTFIYVNII